MPELVSSSSNPLIKMVRSLRQRKGRAETGLFLVEGIHPVGAAVEAGWDLETLIYAPDQLTSDYGLGLIADQTQRGTRCVPLALELFDRLAEKENPQGILAIVHQQRLNLEQIPPDQFHFGAAVIAPQDPGNVGTILRTLDAVAADGLFLLDGGVDPYHPSSIRASMGALFWVPFVRTSFEEFFQWGQQHAFTLVGSSAHAGQGYRDLKRTDRPTILLLGSEQKGLSQDQMQACDLTVSLPMKGRGSSLNLAVAAGILIYSLLENRSSPE